MHPLDGGGMMLQMWQRAYSMAQASPPETWRQGIFRPGADLAVAP